MTNALLPLSVNGSQIVDSEGRPVSLARGLPGRLDEPGKFH